MVDDHGAQTQDMDKTVRFAGDLVDRAATQSGYLMTPSVRTALIMDFIARWFGTTYQKPGGQGIQNIKIDWNA